MPSVRTALSALAFRLDVRQPERRRIVVAAEIDRADAVDPKTGVAEFFLPTWTPGSYLIREYARHLGPVRAFDVGTGTVLPCRKVAKNRYRIELGSAVARIRLEYDVYAHELTVRTADVGAGHAYWNHACVLLWPVDRRDVGARVRVLTPPGWDLVGGVPVTADGDQAFAYELEDLDDAIDAPMLAGTFRRLELEVRSVRHVLALDGLGSIAPPAHFEDDVRRIVERAADVFGVALPYPHYTFLCLFAQAGHGGLEHCNSTTLLSPRTALAGGKPYREFLGLLAHELFHAWNVKRMRPAELWSYDYERENHTEMLWLAEGWTAYYDDLLCRRAGVLGVDDYLALVAHNLTHLWSSPGRFRQSLAESSYDAWIRYYRPDENTRNQTQNYYGNGALAAMVLDLAIRHATAGRRCLDDALRELWRTTYAAGRGYRRDDVAAALSAAAGHDLGDLLQTLTAGPLDADFAASLAAVGVLVGRGEQERPWFGLSLASGSTRVATVIDDTPAHRSGIAPGDEILALDGLRVTDDTWGDIVTATAAIDRPLNVLLATRGVVVERTLVPIASPHGAVKLTLAPDVTAEIEALRRGWLGVDSKPS